MAMIPPVRHDLKRKQNLAYGRITDNAGQVQVTRNENFDLSNTIFKTIPQVLKTASLYQRWKISIFISKLDLKYKFDESKVQAIEAAYAKVQKPLADDSALFKFMLTECEFACEHAEGHFLDHLHFCREYSALHYSAAATSPRVMLCHSIMGLGTNLFPMPKEKVPTLRKLLSPEDFGQVECFPSFMRLMVHGYFLTELATYDAAQLGRIRKIRVHRLIDNEPLDLSAAQMWDARAHTPHCPHPPSAFLNSLLTHCWVHCVRVCACVCACVCVCVCTVTRAGAQSSEATRQRRESQAVTRRRVLDAMADAREARCSEAGVAVARIL